ncbi:hypothetical protein, partial [Peribacillus deserti]|uniref:hypothetical protein n=1 Tax=Peribacillus deserti TaxID=673318 RepID=UPI001C60D372
MHRMCEPGGATGRGVTSVVRATKLLSSLSLANQQVFFIRCLLFFYRFASNEKRSSFSFWMDLFLKST